MTKRTPDRELRDLSAGLAKRMSVLYGEPVAVAVVTWSKDGRYQTWTNVERPAAAQVLQQVGQKMAKPPEPVLPKATAAALDAAAEPSGIKARILKAIGR